MILNLKNSILAVLLLAVALLGCHQAPPAQYLDIKVKNRISEIFSNTRNKELLIYYFDGDCSICIGAAKFIESKLKPNQAGIFIANTLNPDALAFNKKTIGIKSQIYVDSRHEFSHVLKMDSLLAVEKDGEMHTISFDTLK